MQQEYEGAAVRGHDAPVAARELDDYDRWPLASAISNIIQTTPAEWSTRVGLYGSWGTGKTSVLNFLEFQQRKTGNIVIRYSPWGASNEEDVWRDCAIKLRSGLKAHGIALGIKETTKHKVKRVAKPVSLLWRGLGKAGDESLKIPIASVVADATVQFIGLGHVRGGFP